MKDSELDQLLKSIPVPDRPEAYWSEFPRKVMAKAHWLESRTQAGDDDRGVRQSGTRFRLRFVTAGLAVAVIGLVLGFAFGFRQGRHLVITDSQLALARKYFQEIEPLFPNQIQAIVFDQQGPHLVLADQPNVPASSPLYLRISGPKGIQNYVTFSGQQVRLNGEVCEVLVDHEGNALLVGREGAWSTTQAQAKNARYQVTARTLAKL
jgi:hypothetical protein